MYLAKQTHCWLGQWVEAGQQVELWVLQATQRVVNNLTYDFQRIDHRHSVLSAAPGKMLKIQKREEGVVGLPKLPVFGTDKEAEFDAVT